MLDVEAAIKKIMDDAHDRSLLNGVDDDILEEIKAAWVQILQAEAQK